MKANRLWSLRAGMLCAAAATVAVSGCATPKAKVEKPGALVVSRGAARHGRLQEQWQIPLTLGHDQVRNVWVENGTVYISTQRGFLLSVNGSQGTINWRGRFGDGVVPLLRPDDLPKRKIVLLASNGHLLFLNRATGRPVKQYLLKFPPGTGPLEQSRTILIGSLQDRFNGLFFDTPTAFRWAMPSRHDSFISQPILLPGRRVVFASRRGFVWKKDARAGNAGWNRKVAGGVRAPLSASTTDVLVPCTDGQVYSFAISSGDVDWQAQLNGDLRQPAVPDARLVLQVDATKTLYALSARSGQIKWTVNGVRTIAAHTARDVYVAGLHNNLRVLNGRSGKLIARVPSPFARYYATRVHGTSIYMVTVTGTLAKLSPRAR